MFCITCRSRNGQSIEGQQAAAKSRAQLEVYWSGEGSVREMKGTMKLTTLSLTTIAILSFAAAVFAQQPQATPPPPTAPRTVQFPKPVEKILPNGLRVVVVQRSEMPLISSQLLIKSGGEVDPADL